MRSREKSCEELYEHLSVSDARHPLIMVMPAVPRRGQASAPLDVRGAIVLEEGQFRLMVRHPTISRLGGDKWVATCARLGLPEPPVDQGAPKVFSEWREVAQWDPSQPVEVGRST